MKKTSKFITLAFAAVIAVFTVGCKKDDTIYSKLDGKWNKVYYDEQGKVAYSETLDMKESGDITITVKPVDDEMTEVKTQYKVTTIEYTEISVDNNGSPVENIRKYDGIYLWTEIEPASVNEAGETVDAVFDWVQWRAISSYSDDWLFLLPIGEDNRPVWNGTCAYRRV